VTVVAFADLASRVLAGPARLGGVRLVGVDGPSGAGKTTFADRLAAAVAPRATVGMMHTDAILDGWEDPLSVWPRLAEWVLDPLSRGVPGAHPTYDWLHARYGDEWRAVPVSDVLILEGTTAACAAIRPRLTLSVFVTAGREVRTRRALSRDGGQIAAPLEAWQEAEDQYFVTQRTEAYVDVVVDGATEVGHDPGKAFVRTR
jgi:uridine kinase